MKVDVSSAGVGMVPARDGERTGRRGRSMNAAEQIKQVEGLRGAALREKFREVTGLETRSNNRPYLVKRIVHALQAGAHDATKAPAAPSTAAGAGASAPARRTRAAVARKPTEARAGSKRDRDARIPSPGTVIEREYDGRTIRVKVLADGFEFQGKAYRSLSAVAREATGTTWNGLLFFHLIPYAKRAKAA